MPGATTSSTLDRGHLMDWYDRNRARSAALFDLLTEETYYSRPIALRHPIVFYEGHLPAFSFNTLVKRGLGRPGIDEALETLFARGIDPHESNAPDNAASIREQWPSRETVRQFAAEADRQVMDALANGDITRAHHPLLHEAEAAYCILEHEAMHQETLLYMWHRLPLDQKRRPDAYRPATDGAAPEQAWIDVPAGHARLGVDRGAIPFSWDNERSAHTEPVLPFAVQQHNVTNADYREFVDAGGYGDERWWRPADWTWIQGDAIAHPLFWERESGAWLWRGMFDRLPLPASWPVYVSQAEAMAYARWRGCRLMTEAEFHRAAYGHPEEDARAQPWGDEPPQPAHGVFDFESWDPQPAGTHPRGASAWGVHDLVGNGWEWTTTPFAPFPDFRPLPSYPEYSADFFDNEHFVIKGASPATARELIRPSFRNWFRGRYPYVYASFRCVKEN
jgi:ergothioneine biosynthesis protein EgtB